ncbi:hypothetical protein LXL04_012759 [Taraxacum kok-saghyz]
MESHPVIAADMESHHQAAASEIHKELTFNRPKTEISAECEIEMASSLLLLPFPVQIDLPTGLKESSPSRQKSESSPSTQKSTPTAMKFKTEISADCEIEKDVKLSRDIKRKNALLNWKWDAVIDLEDDASDDGWDADEDYHSDDVSTDGSYDQSETEPTATPPKKIPRVTVHKRHRLSRVCKEWDAIGFDMVEASIMLEDMIKTEYLRKEWRYWSSPSAAAKIPTLSAFALQIYALDAAIYYHKPPPLPPLDPPESVTTFGNWNSEPKEDTPKKSKLKEKRKSSSSTMELVMPGNWDSESKAETPKKSKMTENRKTISSTMELMQGPFLVYFCNYLFVSNSLPPVPKNNEKTGYGGIQLQKTSSLLDILDSNVHTKAIESDNPISMEAAGISRNHILKAAISRLQPATISPPNHPNSSRNQQQSQAASNIHPIRAKPSIKQTVPPRPAKPPKPTPENHNQTHPKKPQLNKTKQTKN